MRPTNHSILLGLAALASFVSAAPQKNTGAGVHIIGIGNLLDIPVDKVDPNTLWRSSKSGDRVRLSVSDDKITYGNAGPWQIMEGFRQACKSALCPASFNVPAECEYSLAPAILNNDRHPLDILRPELGRCGSLSSALTSASWPFSSRFQSQGQKHMAT